MDSTFDFLATLPADADGCLRYEGKVRHKLEQLGEKDEPSDRDVDLVDRLVGELDRLQRARADRIAVLEGRVASGELRCEPAVPGGRSFSVNRHPDPWGERGLESGADIKRRALTAVETAAKDDREGRGECASRILERAETPSSVAEYLIDISSPAYFRAFGKVAAFSEGGAAVRMTDDERRAMLRAQESARALAIGSGATGHYSVPFELDPTIILTNAGVINPIRSVARVIQVTTDEWHGVSSDGVTAAWTAEAAPATDGSPTLAQPEVTVHKATAFVPFSLEIQGDWAGIAGEMATLIRDAKDRLEGAAMVTGSGIGQPRGIVTALDANTNSEVAVTTNNALGVADIYAVYSSLPPRHRANPASAAWLMNTPYLNLIRQMGTANNYHGFTVDLTESGFPSLLGRRVLETSEMDSAVGTGVDNALIIGDFSHYVIADRVGLSVELIPHLFDVTNNRPTGQRGWYAWWRVGADSVHDGAFRLLQV